MSGEMLLAIGYGLVMVLGGAFVWWKIRTYYDDRSP